ncbi:MAG: DUF2786 domain-containing protein [Myxococcales bacterium]|nr:DUF2786 domain-containing protein [Myxococcales bacterium]
MSVDQKIIERISKLLALAAGTSSIHEAESAERQAMELMRKYMISASDLQAQRYVIQQHDTRWHRIPGWASLLMHTICSFVGVYDLYITGRADADVRARELMRWKRKVRSGWPEVRVTSVTAGVGARELGEPVEVRAVVDLGTLSPDGVEVSLLHGPVDLEDELHAVTATTMVLEGPEDGPALVRYVGTISPAAAGDFGYTVRVAPAHDDLTGFAELGLVAFASVP